MDRSLQTRTLRTDQLAAVNRVVECAVSTWDLPARVKRLSLPSYRYGAADFETMSLLGAFADGELVGVAAWQSEHGAARLHGLYVDPDHWRRGIGSLLLGTVETAAADQGFSELRVKAQPGARGFFRKHGYGPVAPAPGRYAHSLCKPLARQPRR